MRTIGTIFVHGIAQTRQERAGHLKRFRDLLARHSVDGLLKTEVASWRSSGRFDWDLDLLYRCGELREDAIEDVGLQILMLQDHLHAIEGSHGILVVGHSMGQVLAYMALQRYAPLWFMPVSLLTMGGPLGNTNPVYDTYLHWAHKGPLVCVDWIDIWNPDDPIPSNVISPASFLDHLPQTPEFIKALINRLDSNVPKVLTMHRAFENAQPVRFDYGPKLAPNPIAALKEHSSYFENDFCFNVLRNMKTKLEGIP